MLYANTDEGSSAIWVLDGNGVVVDNISYSIADRAPILEQINEHYGTSFTRWSDNEIALSYGSTLPNWNAYEKITIQGYFAVNFGYNVFGYLKEGVFETPRNEDGETYTADNNGVIIEQTVVSPGHPGYNEFIQAVKDRFMQNNIIINEIVGKIETYSVGDNIANWNEYTKL